MSRDKTGIGWTDATWNPTTGCDRVSPGCDNCYALTMAKRLKAMGAARYQVDGDPRTSGPGFGITEHPDALTQPWRRRRPRRVFVNSMSDLFHPGVSDEFIARVFVVMAAAPRHTFQVLTKRHGRMRSLLASDRWADLYARAIVERPKMFGLSTVVGPRPWPLPNVWLGVSAETQQWADIRIPALWETPAAVRFVSAEPLLGPLDLSDHLTCGADWPGHDCSSAGAGCRLDWVIAGGESGPGARPAEMAWFQSLRDQCAASGTALFTKQLGTRLAKACGIPGKGTDPAQWPEPFPQDYPPSPERPDTWRGR